MLYTGVSKRSTFKVNFGLPKKFILKNCKNSFRTKFWMDGRFLKLIQTPFTLKIFSLEFLYPVFRKNISRAATYYKMSAYKQENLQYLD